MLEEIKQRFNQSVESLRADLAGVRTGRASSGLVENLVVDVYGSKMPLLQIASITVPDARSIAIQPWDKANLAPIEKSIRESELSLNPVNDGIIIRIAIPPLSEERREELVKLANQKVEQGKVSIRNIRHDAKSKLDAQLKDKSIGEDEHARLEKQIQDLVNDFNSKIDEMQKQKDAEIRTV